MLSSTVPENDWVSLFIDHNQTADLYSTGMEKAAFKKLINRIKYRRNGKKTIIAYSVLVWNGRSMTINYDV